MSNDQCPTFLRTHEVKPKAMVELDFQGSDEFLQLRFDQGMMFGCAFEKCFVNTSQIGPGKHLMRIAHREKN